MGLTNESKAGIVGARLEQFESERYSSELQLKLLEATGTDSDEDRRAIAHATTSIEMLDKIAVLTDEAAHLAAVVDLQGDVAQAAGARTARKTGARKA